ncbi:hypothetical protein FHX51_000928 [Aeriscardovia aeriphila]|uniref:Uncharacterized protein n=1 Tax=Aeriscardovia aeriphila TaxID=218139 RepID=A0A261F9S1_9BIFI|nr:hypothetical protein [Aeriscardovia aeriphila]OZG55872.1 hypothetical protein AEAE_0360 [Aeriscardovia aeriphila]
MLTWCDAIEVMRDGQPFQRTRGVEPAVLLPFLYDTPVAKKFPQIISPLTPAFRLYDAVLGCETRLK